MIQFKLIKFDIRDWSECHEKLGKGVTLTNEEVKNLRDIFKQYRFKRTLKTKRRALLIIFGWQLFFTVMRGTTDVGVLIFER